MGIFKKQQPVKKPTTAAEHLDDQNFFDDYFREELRNRGRWHFERVISENADLFKQDLDATIAHLHDELKTRIVKEVESAVAQVNLDVKNQVTTQLNTQLAEYRTTLNDTKTVAVEALNHGKEVLEAQQRELSQTLQRSIHGQQEALTSSFEQSKARMDEMSSAQKEALDWLNTSIQSLKQEQADLSETLRQNVAQQKELMIKTFEENMARIVEHYLLTAVGDQYDVKSQLPSILQQLEANKQAMMDDIKL